MENKILEIIIKINHGVARSETEFHCSKTVKLCESLSEAKTRVTQ